jgi:hypothetical protein
MDIGLLNSVKALTPTVINSGTGTLELDSDGSYYCNNTHYGSGGPAYNTAGTTIGIAVDVTTGNWWWRNASGWNPGGDPGAGTSPMGTLTSSAMNGGIVPFITAYASNGKMRANFGNAPFVLGAVPTGFNPGWGVF